MSVSDVRRIVRFAISVPLFRDCRCARNVVSRTIYYYSDESDMINVAIFNSHVIVTKTI